ncbi:MAG: NYN domain-containing protein [Lachnospiraceae bacterium]|nr:NYN domain-containing protein [Lachnospiraceae bacterium]
MNDKRFAVLIDSDNISARYIDCILDEMTRHGVATYRRIYGDFTTNQMHRWKSELAERSITPIQQFQNTTGKNATDSALIIDAMDILYTGNVEGFCIVSSDGDFTRLASRLRESGMEVIGMGEGKTPKSFKAACSVFTNIELLIEGDNEKSSERQEKKNVVTKKKISDAIVEIITTNENNGRDTGLGEIGSALVKKYSDFDVRNYGYSSLSRFIEEIDNFELRRNKTSISVVLKSDAREIEDFAIEVVKKSGVTGIDIGQLAQKIYDRYPNFKVKKLGYSTFQKFVHSIREIQIENLGNNQKNVYMRR